MGRLMAVIDIIVATVQAEFSGLQEVEQMTRATVRMVVALVLGALIG